MLCTTVDALRSPHGVRDRIVVVGAGAVGLYLAKLLADRGRHVVVVEAGGTALAAFEESSFRSVGRDHAGMRAGRTRALGGTSNLWGGQLVTFQPQDLAGRPWVPGSSWPIGFDELAPYHERTLDALGVPRRFRDDREVWQAVVGEVPDVGPGLELFLTRWLRVPQLPALYADEVYRSRSLQVLLDHPVVGFTGGPEAIDGVVARAPGGARVEIPAGTVVVAAGAIETVRLLLAAAADPGWDCPWRGNDMLGRRFQDHLGGPVGLLRTDDRKQVTRVFSTIRWKGQKYQPKLRLAAGRRAGDRLLGVTGIVWFRSDVYEHAVYLKRRLQRRAGTGPGGGAGELAGRAAAVLRHAPRLARTYLRDHRVAPPPDADVVFSVQAEQLPLDQSRVRLDDQAPPDEHGLPAVVLDWQVDGSEARSIAVLLEEARAAFAARGLGTLDVDDAFLAGEPGVLDRLHDTNHASGGCVMGESPDDGVVDRDLRVFGTASLYVVGTAVFRTSSDANVTFTALALATRLADHLTAGPR